MLEPAAEPPQSIPDLDIDRIVVEMRPLADWWGARIQWCEDDHEDLVQEGLLELIKTLRSYQKSARPIQDVKAIASVCFSAAMKWWYKKSDRKLEFTSIHELTIPVDNMEVYFSEIYVDRFLKELDAVHGPVARVIVQNLLNPDESVGAVVLREMKRKKSMKDAGSRVIGHATARPQKQHIREALGLDTTEWDKTMASIKTFTREYLCREHESGNGTTTNHFSTRPAN